MRFSPSLIDSTTFNNISHFTAFGLSESLLLLTLLISLTAGSSLYRLWNWKHPAPRVQKKAGGRPGNVVPDATVEHESTPGSWPNSVFHYGKRKVDLTPGGNMGRYWIRHFHQPDDDVLASALDSWNADPYGYDPTAPLSSEMFKK